MKDYLSFYHEETKMWFYLDQRVKDNRTGKIGIVREISPFKQAGSMLIKFKSGTKFYKKDKLINLTSV